MQAAKNELQKQCYKMDQNSFTESIFEFCYFKLTKPNMFLELLYLKETPALAKTIG